MHDTALIFIYRIVNFDIMLGGSSGGRGPNVDTFDEGVEFGFQNLNCVREWIPLAFYSFHIPTMRDEQIKIGPELMFGDNITVIRGYSVPIHRVGSTMAHGAELKLCGSEIIQNMSFRWLQTVVTQSTNNSDTVYLDNVAISINFPEGHNIMMLLDDDFNDEMMIK